MALGAAATAGEFRHGTATVTYLAVPARTRVLTAKCCAALPVGALFGIAASAASTAVGLAFVAAHGYPLAVPAATITATPPAMPSAARSWPPSAPPPGPSSAARSPPSSRVRLGLPHRGRPRRPVGLHRPLPAVPGRHQPRRGHAPRRQHAPPLRRRRRGHRRRRVPPGRRRSLDHPAQGHHVRTTTSDRPARRYRHGSRPRTRTAHPAHHPRRPGHHLIAAAAAYYAWHRRH